MNESESLDNLELASSKLSGAEIMSIGNLQVPNCQEFPMDDFLHIGFTHHRMILGKVKNFNERIFYLKRCAGEHFTVEALKESLAADDYHHQGNRIQLSESSCVRTRTSRSWVM